MLLPYVQQQLSDKSHLTGHAQALEITNEAHRQSNEEKNAAITLLNNDLKSCEHDNVALQAKRDVYKDQLQNLSRYHYPS